LALVCGITASADAHPQSFPNKPIHIVVAFPPGGTTDVLARFVSEGLTARLKSGRS
jgi:tripartite-type tricarboxylate transporter receptor subunit TctC